MPSKRKSQGKRPSNRIVVKDLGPAIFPASRMVEMTTGQGHGSTGHCSHNTESFSEAYRLLHALCNEKEAIMLLDNAEDTGEPQTLRDIVVEYQNNRYYISVQTMLYRPEEM